MTPEAWTLLAAFLIVSALFVIRDMGAEDIAKKAADALAEAADELAKAADRIEALTKQRNRLKLATDFLKAELVDADKLAIDQARKSLAQQARIAELEADVSMSRAAAHGSAWGPTL